MRGNVASEKAVLSGICKYGADAYIDIEYIISENTFTNDINKVLYSCIKHAINEDNTNVTFASVMSSAQTLNLDEYINREESLSQVREIFDSSIDIDDVYRHAQKIARLEFARKINNELKIISGKLKEVGGNESLSEILSLAESPIQQIALSYISDDNSSPKKISEGIEEYLEFLENNTVEQLGIPSGMNIYDKAIGGGFRRKTVSLIVARMKVGKSVLADNFAIHVAGNMNIPVLMLDTEMSQEDHWARLLANISRIPIDEIESGKYKQDPIKKQNLIKSIQKIKEMPYDYVSVAGKSFDEILSISRRWVKKEVGYDEEGRVNDCLIILDYLKLMNSSEIKDVQEYQMLGFQISALHNFCVEFDCPCVTFAQINRDGISKESTDIVSGSDRLAWLCTNLTIFKTKTEEEIANDGIRAGNRKLVPLVARHGPGILDDGYICVNMEGEYANIKELGTVRDLENENEDFPDKEDQDGDDEEDSCPF